MMRTNLLRGAVLAGAIAAAGAAMPTAAHAQSGVLRIVPHAALTVLDPMWTTAYSSRNHGYMVYDTLFGMDAAGQYKPQMVERWTTSDDRKTWTFTLRDGL